VNTICLGQSLQQIAGSRRIGVLVNSGCEILGVCSPYDAFFHADAWLTRFGRIGETGYRCIVIAAARGPVRTKCGIEISPTRTFDEVGENLDTLVDRHGTTENARFEVAMASEFPGNDLDLVTCFDCLHDMGDPIGAARHVRETLKPDGSWMTRSLPTTRPTGRATDKSPAKFGSHKSGADTREFTYALSP
jgi:hypothetical protein